MRKTTLALLLLGTAACSSGSPFRNSLDDLADQLLQSVELRKDPSTIQVFVYEIHRIPGSSLKGNDEVPDVGEELKHELVATLSPMIHVVESENLQPICRNPEHDHYGQPVPRAPVSGRNSPVVIKVPGRGTTPTHSEDSGLVDVRQLASCQNANTVLFGDWVPINDHLFSLSLRMVDVDSNLVIGAARGTIDFDRTKKTLGIF